MQVHQCRPDGRHACDEFGDLGAADIGDVGLRGEDIGEVGDESGVAIGGEIVGVEVEFAGQRQQHRHRHGSLIVLELVDVAGRQVDPPGQRCLGQPAFVA